MSLLPYGIGLQVEEETNTTANAVFKLFNSFLENKELNKPFAQTVDTLINLGALFSISPSLIALSIFTIIRGSRTIEVEPDMKDIEIIRDSWFDILSHAQFKARLNMEKEQPYFYAAQNAFLKGRILAQEGIKNLVEPHWIFDIKPETWCIRNLFEPFPAVGTISQGALCASVGSIFTLICSPSVDFRYCNNDTDKKNRLESLLKRKLIFAEHLNFFAPYRTDYTVLDYFIWYYTIICMCNAIKPEDISKSLSFLKKPENIS